MRNSKAISNITSVRLVILLSVVLVITGVVRADWLKQDTPPDVDKKSHNHTNASTCWLATASNMLAGAGYGSGATVQVRADNIYNQMVTKHGTGSGWTNVAVEWWLGSSHNTQKGINPYTSVTVYGNKTGKAWLHQSEDGSMVSSDDGAQFLGNELRRCQFVGVSIHSTAGGHAITAWGDDEDPNVLTDNPSKLTVSDSDKDTGGDLQTYGYNFSSGWYVSYAYSPAWYIKHIITLCGDTNDPNEVSTQKIVSSLKTFNSSRTFLNQSATDVHYKVCSNSHILWYDTGIDWQTSNSLIISEDPCSPRKYIDVSCDLSDNPVPPGNAVTATTELVVPYDSNLPAAISNTSMNYTYPTPDLALPIHGWSLEALELAMGRDANTLNITGGYVIGAYDFFNDPGGAEPNKIQEYRFCCEYTYFQEPENHEFTLIPLDAPEPAWVGNFRFGHSYGLLTDEVLWMFDDWDVDEDSIESFVPGAPIVKPIYLPGLLPYPMGENYVAPAGCEAANIDDTGRVELKDYSLLAGTWNDNGAGLAGDIDENGTVDFNDVKMLTDCWLDECVPQNQHWAVIVGISDYNAIPDKNYCHEDANDWYNYFTALGYEHIWVYGDTNPGNYAQYDGLATEENIQNALQNVLSSADSNDVIAFIFSGHGDNPGTGNVSLRAWDATAGVGGHDGALWDYELASLFGTSVASRVFIFLDSCFSGGMIDDLAGLPNATTFYAAATCTDVGCSNDEPAYNNGAWSYWFEEAGLVNHYASNPGTSMEACFSWADAQYNPGGDDEPMEFDGDASVPFTLAD